MPMSAGDRRHSGVWRPVAAATAGVDGPAFGLMTERRRSPRSAEYRAAEHGISRRGALNIAPWSTEYRAAEHGISRRQQLRVDTHAETLLTCCRGD